MSDISHSKKVNAALIIFGSIAVIFVMFALGVYVGYSKANFAAGRSDNYYRNFMGGAPMGVGFAGGMPGSTHGIAGTVIDVASSSIVVKDSDNDEQSIGISTGTIVRRADQTVGINGFLVGDSVAVIGDPNASGQIEARFVRIFPSSSLPSSPPATPMSDPSNGVIINTL